MAACQARDGSIPSDAMRTWSTREDRADFAESGHITDCGEKEDLAGGRLGERFLERAGGDNKQQYYCRQFIIIGEKRLGKPGIGD